MAIGLSGVQFGLLSKEYVMTKLDDLGRSGSLICLSRVWLQTELDDTRWTPLLFLWLERIIIKITISSIVIDLKKLPLFTNSIAKLLSDSLLLDSSMN